MVNFTDKKGRKIEIDDGDSDIVAYHKGIRIGTIEIENSEDGSRIWGMNVSTEYHRAGIAYRMMEIVVDLYGKDIGKPQFNGVGGRDAECDTYYTQEGAAFIRYCITTGLLVDTDNDEECDW